MCWWCRGVSPSIRSSHTKGWWHWSTSQSNTWSSIVSLGGILVEYMIQLLDMTSSLDWWVNPKCRVHILIQILTTKDIFCMSCRRCIKVQNIRITLWNSHNQFHELYDFYGLNRFHPQKYNSHMIMLKLGYACFHSHVAQSIDFCKKKKRQWKPTMNLTVVH